MRIHGVHLNGLDSPRGAHQLACEPGYTVVVCPDPGTAERLAGLLRALLCEPDALAGRGRAELVFSLGREAYRVVVDLDRSRVALARHSGGGRSERVASGGLDVARALHDAGMPDARDLERICIWPPAGWSESYEDLERRIKEFESVLSEFAPVADELEGLPASVALFQAAEAERARTLRSVSQHREALQRDRRRLRGAPRLRIGLAWAGVALAAAAALAALRIDPVFWAAAALGPPLAVACALGVRAARRGLGRLESRLASLRAAEREARSRFDAETVRVRRLLAALELDSADALLRVAESFGEAAEQLEQLRTQLQVVRRDSAPAPDVLASLIETAARVRGIDSEVVRERLAPVLPVYLRALSGGSQARARWERGAGWQICPASGAPARRLDALAPADRARVELAFRLALLESLAPQLRVPLLVGPDAAQGPALARSLRRLGSVGQVIHVCTDEDDASAHAHGVERLG